MNLDRKRANFYNKTMPIPESGCLIWMKVCRKDGYGRAALNKKRYLAHRLSWIFTFGDIPNGLNVLHKCDVRLCVNPNHLFLGTQQDNIEDMVRKNRRGNFKGVANSKAKLTEDDVREIRSITKNKENYAEVARAYGIHESSIGRIARGETWKHL